VYESDNNNIRRNNIYLCNRIVIVTSVLSYYLGKRKTNTPKMATLIGMLLAFIPSLGLIYIAILVLKNDINQNNTGEGVE
jgi:hydrogenase-4 membrane subunit HyfE